MKLLTHRDHLSAAVRSAAAASGGKTPVTSSRVLLRCGEGTVASVVGDGPRGQILAEFDCDIREPGVALLDPQVVHRLLAECESDLWVVEGGDGGIQYLVADIRGGHVKKAIENHEHAWKSVYVWKEEKQKDGTVRKVRAKEKQWLPVKFGPEHFPEVDRCLAGDDGPRFLVSAPELAQAVHRAAVVQKSHKADADEALYEAGCHLQFAEGLLTVTGLDGRAKMAVTRIESLYGAALPPATISRGGCQLLASVLNSKQGDCEVSVCDTFLTVRKDGVRVAVPKKVATAPPVGQLLEKTPRGGLSVPTPDLKQFVRRFAATMADLDGTPHKINASLRLDIGDGRISGFARGHGTAVVNCEQVIGKHKTMDLKVDWEYLSRCVQALPDESVAEFSATGRTLRIDAHKAVILLAAKKA